MPGARMGPESALPQERETSHGLVAPSYVGTVAYAARNPIGGLVRPPVVFNGPRAVA